MAEEQTQTSNDTQNGEEENKRGILITQEEYATLTEEEKANYVIYDPAMYDPAVAKKIKQANAQMKVLEKIEPAIEKVKVMPQPLPAEQVNKALDSYEKALSLLDPIKELEKVPIIGQLAKAVVNILNAIFQIIGFILLIMFYISRGAEIFTDQVKKAWDNIDVDEVSNDIKEAKEIESAPTEDPPSNEEKTEGEESAGQQKKGSDEINYEKIPTAEMKKKVQDLDTSVEQMSDTLDIVNAGTRAIDITVDAVYSQFSWDAMYPKIEKTLDKIGLDTSPLNQPTEAQMKAFDKILPSPKLNMQKMRSSLDSLKEKKQYITTEDAEKLKNATPEDVVSLTDRLSEHFVVGDFCVSTTASKNKIKNIPSKAEVENLKRLCVNILEKVWHNYGPVTITSGYRSMELNKLVNKDTSTENNVSQHCLGQAADIEVKDINTITLAKWIVEHCDYDQVIVEKCNNLYCDPNSGWVHVSYKNKDSNRRQQKQSPDGKRYADGFPKLPAGLA